MDLERGRNTKGAAEYLMSHDGLMRQVADIIVGEVGHE